MLSKEQILSKTVLKQEVVNVPEWGGEVIVSEMNGTDRDAWEQSLVARDENRKLVNARAKLVAFTVVGEAGARMFNDEDVTALGILSSVALDRVVKVSQRLNGLTDRDIEESEKN